jgi:hypothetical protein
MVGAYESPAKLVCHRNLREAHEAAIREAASASAFVQEVRGVSIRLEAVEFVGTTFKRFLINNVTGQLYEETSYVRLGTDHPGYFHTDWEKITTQAPPLGFFTFYPPLNSISFYSDDQNPDDTKILIAIKLKRIGNSLAKLFYGEAACDCCGTAIGIDRMKAKPGTRHCVTCVSHIEKGVNHYGNTRKTRIWPC